MSKPPVKKQKVEGPGLELRHLIPTLMTIVVQSLKINDHHHYIESKIVFDNLCSILSVGPNDVGKFLCDKICLWEFKVGKHNYLNFGYHIKKQADLENSIARMHGTLKDLSVQFKKIDMHNQSLMFEMKGTRNYVATTWQRVDIVALSFSIIRVLFESIAIQDVTCDSVDNAILEFTHDVMIDVGRHRTACVRFLQKVCLCLGSENNQDIMGRDNVWEHFTEVWQKRKKEGPSMFIGGIDSWAKHISTTDLEFQVVASSLDTMMRYLDRQRKNATMSMYHINRRMLPSQQEPQRSTARPSSLTQTQIAEFRQQQVQLYWWNFLCSKTYKMYMKGEANEKKIYRARLEDALPSLERNKIIVQHGDIAATASPGTDGSPTLSKTVTFVDVNGITRKRPYGWREEDDSAEDKEDDVREEDECADDREDDESEEESEQGGSEKDRSEEELEEDGHKNDGDVDVESEEEKEEEEEEQEESSEEEEEEEPTKRTEESTEEEEEEEPIERTEKEPGDMQLATNPLGGAEMDDDTEMIFRRAYAKERKQYLFDYVYEEKNERHYVEWTDQVVSIHREFELVHGVRATSFFAFPRHWYITSTEVCHRLGVHRFATTYLSGIRLNPLLRPLPKALDNELEQLCDVFPEHMMNYLVRQTGGRILTSNMGADDVDGKIRHLHICITDPLSTEGEHWKDKFLEQVSNMGQHVWACHKHLRPAEGLEELEKAPSTNKLRSILRVTDKERIGFEDATVDVFVPLGSFEYDKTLDKTWNVFGRKYEWTAMNTLPFIRLDDGRMFYVVYKFYHGRVQE